MHQSHLLWLIICTEANVSILWSKIVPHLELTHIVILVCPIGLLGKVLASKSKVSHPIALPITP